MSHRLGTNAIDSGEMISIMCKYIATKQVWFCYYRCGQRGYINCAQTKVYKCKTSLLYNCFKLVYNIVILLDYKYTYYI